MERPQRERRGTRKIEALHKASGRQLTTSPRKAEKEKANKENNTPDILTPCRGPAVKFTHLHESLEFAHTQTGAFTVIGPASFNHEGATFSGDMKALDDLLDRSSKQYRKAYQLMSHKLAGNHANRWNLEPYLPKGEQISLPRRRKAQKLLREYEYESSDGEDDDMVDASLEAQGTENRVAAAIVHNKHRLRVLKASLTAALAPHDPTLGQKNGRKQRRSPEKRSATALVRARTDSNSSDAQATCDNSVGKVPTMARTDSKSLTAEPRPIARHVRDLQIDMVDAPSLRDAGASRQVRSGHVTAVKHAVSRPLSFTNSSSLLDDQTSEPAAKTGHPDNCTARPKRLSRPTEKARLTRSASPPVTNSHESSTKSDCDAPEETAQENISSRIVVLTFKSTQAQAKFGELVNSRGSLPAIAGPIRSLADNQTEAKSLNTLGRPMSPFAASERSEMSSSPKGTKRKLETSPDVDGDEHPKKRLRLNVRPPVRRSATEDAPQTRLKLILRRGDKACIADHRATA
ncbi:hypothetical protein B0A48_04438 [Cryoendolithus antarcticus]|uniref:Uncharacterized protein n=1 Tax=Cryoendolithus antarcticus TaxID=1507870 RepID=A0A1V8TFT2_9PEZI|nr:hypothetical protein B0A48_04438 [Cryoendolithus antarcticus]